jgi:hypothetical protein
MCAAVWWLQLVLDLVCLDREPSWAAYAERLVGTADPTARLHGSGFVAWDFDALQLGAEGGLAGQLEGRRLDYVILSYVLEVHMAEDAHCDMMAGWLQEDGVRAILVNSRSPSLNVRTQHPTPPRAVLSLKLTFFRVRRPRWKPAAARWCSSWTTPTPMMSGS